MYLPIRRQRKFITIPVLFLLRLIQFLPSSRSHAHTHNPISHNKYTIFLNHCSHFYPQNCRISLKYSPRSAPIKSPSRVS
ncbi:hypothetical protein L6452_13554 [Arctium lappa]|uniref:Uncharacterized protein n=1 Tax=Arctium lappa TaxID=4217 RepID=A0ACB9CII0_ARCLA|nr:hypothetical protein L6452_13554 [Arctium lappa]